MTTDELRRLAEIAGVETDTSPAGDFIYWCDNTGWYDWQPHLNIEQAMMVAEHWPTYEIGKNGDTEFPFPCYYCQLSNLIGSLDAEGQGQTPAAAICAAALAAGRE